MTLGSTCAAGHFAEVSGGLGPFLLFIAWADDGGDSEREKDTPPVLERVAGDSLSLENREGGVTLEGEA